MTETRSFVEIFFNYLDAEVWFDAHVSEFEATDEYSITEASLTLLPGGGWRAGVVAEKVKDV